MYLKIWARWDDERSALLKYLFADNGWSCKYIGRFRFVRNRVAKDSDRRRGSSKWLRMSQSVAKLPSLEHLLMKDFEEVYEPSEDTYLVCDAIEKDRAYFCDEMKPELILEVGSGSGCVITFLAQLLKENEIKCECIATDINPKAIDVSRRTAEANGVIVECVHTIDLITGLERRLYKRVDVLIFNPPYVPTSDEEVWNPKEHSVFPMFPGNEGKLRSNQEQEQEQNTNMKGARPTLEGTDLDTLITATWAGGENGRIVIDRFLPLLPNLLTPLTMTTPNTSSKESKGSPDNEDTKRVKGGICYLVLVEENKPDEIIDILHSMGLKGEICLRGKARNEYLQIMLIRWIDRPADS